MYWPPGTADTIMLATRKNGSLCRRGHACLPALLRQARPLGSGRSGVAQSSLDWVTLAAIDPRHGIVINLHIDLDILVVSD